MSRTIAIGGSLLLRSVFMLVLSAIVYQVMPDPQTSAFFQILFFQAIVIAFLSASGFFRAQSLETDDDAIVYLSAMLLLVLPSVLLPIALVVLSTGYADYGFELAVIWAGAVATSLGAPLSGYVMRTRGPFRAFIPSAVAALTSVIVVFSVGQWPVWLPYVLIAVFQVGAFVLLAIQVPHLLTSASAALWRDGIKPTYARIIEGASVGAVNVAQLAVIFALRHQWELRADADIAATVFLILRFSDTGIQLLHMVLSGQALLVRVFRTSTMLWVLTITLAVCLIALWGLSGLSLSPLLFALLGQISVDVFRYPGALGFLYQMKVFRLRRYVFFALIPPLVAGLLAGALIFNGHPLAIYVMLVSFTLTGALLTVRDART